MPCVILLTFGTISVGNNRIFGTWVETKWNLFRLAGAEEPDNVRWARIAGMVSSIAVLAMIVLFVFLMVFVFVGVAANVHAN